MSYVIEIIKKLFNIASLVINRLTMIPVYRKPRAECGFCRRSFVAKKNGQPYKHKCIIRLNDSDEKKEALASCKLELETLYDNKESMTDNEYLEGCNLLQQQYNQINARIEETLRLNAR